MVLPGKSLVLNVADCDLSTWGLLLAFPVLCKDTAASDDLLRDATTTSGDLTVVDFCGIFDLVTTTGAGKLLWVGKLLGDNFLLTLSIDEEGLRFCIVSIGEIVLKDCAVGMLVMGLWLETDSESV